MNGRIAVRMEEELATKERRAFSDSERGRWARAQPPKIVGTWAPVLTDEQKQEHDDYVKKHNLPF